MRLTHHLIVIITLISFDIFGSVNYTDTKTIEMDVGQYEQVLLFNKYGEVKVTGIAGDKAFLKVSRSIEAKSKTELEKAKSEIYMDTMDLKNHLYFYIQNPYSILEIEGIGENAYYNSRQSDKWRWSHNGDRDVKYEFTFEVQLPMNKDFRVSTHKKDLFVKGMKGTLNAAAHYGNIKLEGVRDLESVHGHHGNIFVNFDSNPTVNGECHTHHGKIELEFSSLPSADIDMYSYRGEFYTDFDWEPMPQVILKEKHKKGTKYKVGSNTSVRMGSGEQKISLRTHHGDMYILKA